MDVVRSFSVGSQVRQTHEEGIGHIGWNVMNIKMRTIAGKPWMVYMYIYTYIKVLIYVYVCVYVYFASIIWKSDLTDKMKCSFFQAAVVLILPYGCTTWTLTITQECCEQYWTNPGGNTRQRTNYTAYLTSRKLSTLDEADMQDTAGEAKTSS